MAGSSFPTLTAGAIARASDVKARTDWIEGSLVPMSGGSTTDSSLDLGTATAHWRAAWLRCVNPTATGHVLVFGTTAACTTTADSDATVEFAGNKAIILPRLSTTQINNLTSVDGMIAYNTTTGKFNGRQGGAWAPIGGTVYKSLGVTSTTFSNSPGTQTLINISSGGGRVSLGWKAVTGSQANGITIVLDGKTVFSANPAVAASGTGYGWIDGAGVSHFNGSNIDGAAASFDFASTAVVTVDAGGVTGSITYSSVLSVIQ